MAKTPSALIVDTDIQARFEAKQVVKASGLTIAGECGFGMEAVTTAAAAQTAATAGAAIARAMIASTIRTMLMTTGRAAGVMLHAIETVEIGKITATASSQLEALLSPFGREFSRPALFAADMRAAIRFIHIFSRSFRG